MFSISDTLGIRIDDNNQQRLYKLSSKIVTISLLKILELQKFALNPKHNKFLEKINNDTMPGFVENKVEHLLEILKDNTQFEIPDIFEELLINEALQYEVQIKLIHTELKQEIISQLGEDNFQEWKVLLRKFCADHYDYVPGDDSKEAIENFQKKRYRQIYNMCIDPRLSYSDEETENCGVLYWDYDFDYFYDKGFWGTFMIKVSGEQLICGACLDQAVAMT